MTVWEIVSQIWLMGFQCKWIEMNIDNKNIFIIYICFIIGRGGKAEMGHNFSTGLHSMSGWSGQNVGCQKWQMLLGMVGASGCCAGL